MSNHIQWLRKCKVWLPMVAILIAFYPAHGRATDSGFNVQVSPSPLAVKLTPGKQHAATVTVRNLSNHAETLTPGLQGFTIDRATNNVKLQSNATPGLESWISFKQHSLTIAPGASQPLDIIYNTPKDVGFSYAVAITLTQTKSNISGQGATYQASVAVFNLINIDRPDAKRQLEITAFKSDKSRYEFLPATFSLSVRNTGNIIDQPTGTLFIQREFSDTEPITTIPINASGSYVLPDSSRTFSNSWNDGFPHRAIGTSSSGSEQHTRLSWDWGKLNTLRMGKYVAKVVLIYNDGQRDIPLVASYSFWVIPWRLLFVALLIVGLIVTGAIAWVRIVMKGTKKVRKYAHHK